MGSWIGWYNLCFEGVTKFLQGSTGIIVSVLFTATVLAVYYYFQLKVIKKILGLKTTT